METADSVSTRPIVEKHMEFNRQVFCDICKDKVATRLSSWSTACDQCSILEGQQYNVDDIRLQLRITKDRFPLRHRGLHECSVCKKKANNLVILYDEVDDEWLFCGCGKFKQLLRCWNMYTNTMIDYLERPIIKQSKSIEKEQANFSDESDSSISDVGSDGDEASIASSVIESIEYFGDDFPEKGSDPLVIFDSDLPPLEDVIDSEETVIPVIKKARSKKKKSKTAKNTKSDDKSNPDTVQKSRKVFNSDFTGDTIDPDMPDLDSASD